MLRIPADANCDVVVPARPFAGNFQGILATHKGLILVIIFFGVELVLPFLIWKRVLPGATRYAGDLLLLALAGMTFSQMIIQDRIPRVTVALLGISIVGFAVALFEGQDVATTLWGWWLLCRYPLLALFIFLQTDWPDDVWSWLYPVLGGVLAFELFVQVGQYLTGEVPGDNLAGTFGSFGTGELVIFLLFILSIALGRWLAVGDLASLFGIAVVFVIGGLSSALGEMKFFLPSAVALAAVGLLLVLARGKHLAKAVPFVIAVVLIGLLAAVLYNRVPGREKTIDTYLNESTLQSYLFEPARYDSDSGRYHLRRGTAFLHGWQLLQRDTTTLLFGYGLGTRANSKSLGLVGTTLEQDYYGRAVGTSFLVLLQELGILGIGVWGIFTLWACRVFWKLAEQTQVTDISSTAYGMILFSLFWPVWIWYTTVWISAPTMILYWAIFGALMQRWFILEHPSIPGKLAHERT